MNSRNEPFQPESVDEQIHQFTRILSQSTNHATPEMRLVKNLQQVLINYTGSGERVWARLAERSAQQESLPGYLHLLTNEQVQTEKSPPLQAEQHQTLQSQRAKPPSKSQRIFALVAVLLIAALLIGSTFWIFALRPGGNTMVSNKHSISQVSMKTATPIIAMISPQDCPILSQGARALWNHLCTTGQFVAINQSRTLAKGYTETIKGAYADRNQLLIWYDFGPIDAKYLPIPFNTLTTLQGTTLGEWGSSTASREKNRHYAWIEGYDTSNLPASLQTLTVKVTSSVSLVLDGVSGTYPPDKTSFAFFTVPLRSAQMVALHQTIIANGIALTLDHVVISASGIHFVFSVPPMPFRAYSGGFHCTLQVGSEHVLQANTYHSIDMHGANASPTGFEFTFDSDETTQHGAWTLTVTSSGENLPWVFHFTVPS